MFPILPPEFNNPGPTREGEGLVVGGIVLIAIGVISGAILWSYWLLLVSVLGVIMLATGLEDSEPLTDEEKRAYGDHLPPHLRGDR